MQAALRVSLPTVVGAGGPCIAQLDTLLYFHNLGIMEKQDVIAALAALAHETRLDLFRLLVQAAPEGLPAGAAAEALGIPPATLSFHLKELRNAGLVTAEREGRSIRYAPDFASMAALVAYLGENCCAGAGCAPTPGRE
jgi:DNA-binding transcriptional ArsR family regulator